MQVFIVTVHARHEGFRVLYLFDSWIKANDYVEKHSVNLGQNQWFEIDEKNVL